MKNTKIVCTIGPASESEEKIRALYLNGMNVARLNGSHNTLDWHLQVLNRIRKVAPDVPILFDLPGRKIRTAELPKNIVFKSNDEIIFSTDDSTYPKVKVQYENLHSDLKVGDKLLVDDGQYQFSVESIRGRDIYCRAYNSGEIKSKKGINVPFVKIRTPLLSAADMRCIQFCIENEIDLLGVSFVESAEHVNEVKKVIGNVDLQIISKIENQFAVENLDEIISNSFGVMIDRGDLGAETQIFNIAILQKKIIQKSRTLGKPVIVATEMLHHMVHHPFPTKAEINDISNAVLDGCSAVMLSGETAAGEYPVEAVTMMSKVIVESEMHDTTRWKKPGDSRSDVSDAIAESVLRISDTIDITQIVSFSKTGDAIRRLSQFSINKPILFVNNNLKFARKYGIYKGVVVCVFDFEFNPQSVQHVENGLRSLYLSKKIQDEDTLIVTFVKYPNNNFMNSLEVHQVKNLKKVLRW